MDLTKKQKQELQEAEDHYKAVCKRIVEAHYPIGTRFKLVWKSLFGTNVRLGPFKVTGYEVCGLGVNDLPERVYVLYKKVDKLGRANGDEHQISLDRLSSSFHKLPDFKQIVKHTKKKTNA